MSTHVEGFAFEVGLSNSNKFKKVNAEIFFVLNRIAFNERGEKEGRKRADKYGEKNVKRNKWRKTQKMEWRRKTFLKKLSLNFFFTFLSFSFFSVLFSGFTDFQTARQKSCRLSLLKSRDFQFHGII